MSELTSLSNSPLSRAGRVGPGAGRLASSAAGQVPGRDRGEDRVEFSSHVQHLARLKNGGPVRQDLINRIRTQIAEGTYETPEKLDQAIDEMLSDLDD